MNSRRPHGFSLPAGDALASKVLKDMGYAQVYNLGAFKDWVR